MSDNDVIFYLKETYENIKATPEVKNIAALFSSKSAKGERQIVSKSTPKEKTLEILQNMINKELNMILELSNTILQTLLWILIAYVMIRYVQDMLYIEKGYKYLGNLEKEISKEIKEFIREGEDYSKNYPMFLNFIDLFYKMLMPIIFIVINSFRIYKEWKLLDKSMEALLCDTILFLAIFIIVWFYFFEIHSKITNFFKENISFINFIAQKLRKWLKLV